MDCYRMAKEYSRNPVEILAMPIDEVREHLRWTEAMLAMSERKHG